MLSLNDIINVSFRKSGALKGKGYNADDVDNFIENVRQSFEELNKKIVDQGEQIEKLNGEKQQAYEKVKILADKTEEYRAQEDEIKNALISAQKLGDASVREARHKAEIIVKDASIKADRMAADYERKLSDRKNELRRMQKEVSDFKVRLLSLYKEHLTAIDAIPSYRPEPEPAKTEEPQESEAPKQEPAQQYEAPAEPAKEDAGENTQDPFRAQISYFDDDSGSDGQAD